VREAPRSLAGRLNSWSNYGLVFDGLESSRRLQRALASQRVLDVYALEYPDLYRAAHTEHCVREDLDRNALRPLNIYNFENCLLELW